MQNRFEDLKRDNLREIDRRVELDKQLAESCTKNQELWMQISAIKDENDQIKLLEDQNERLKTETQNFCDENSRLKTETQKISEENLVLKNENKKLRQDLNQIPFLNSDISGLQEETQGIRAALADESQ